MVRGLTWAVIWEDWSQRTRVKWIPPVPLQTQQDSKSDRETTLGGSRIPCVHCLRPWGRRKQVCQQCHLTTQWSHFNTKLFYRTAVRRGFVPTRKEILPNTVKVRFSHVKKWTIYTRQKILYWDRQNTVNYLTTILFYLLYTWGFRLWSSAVEN